MTEAFRDAAIAYQAADRSKRELYIEAGPLFATGRVELLDHRDLITELRQLERRTRSGGRDLVDHPPRGHDDRANAACGALYMAAAAGPEITDDMFKFHLGSSLGALALANPGVDFDTLVTTAPPPIEPWEIN